MRGCVVSIAIHAGLPAVAARHGFAALKDFAKQGFAKDVSIEDVVVVVVLKWSLHVKDIVMSVHM